MKTDREYLVYIRECIEVIQDYTAAGRDVLDDLKTQDAVIRRLQVMAETCLRLSDEVQAAHPEVGWQHIRNFRNRLVHEYLDVDVDLIWAIVQQSLPSLLKAVAAELSGSDYEEE